MKKVIDCFPFFNEKELLELRLNLIGDYVDEFIISELNYTHSGKKKDFICRQLVEDLGFSNKVKVIEVEINEDTLSADEIDYYNSKESESSKEVYAWTRERLQRDAVIRNIKDYDDDVVFILGDCDEIINPDFIKYFSEVCRNTQNNIIKIPLVLLEGRADERLFDGDDFVPWSNSLLMCTAKQLKNGGTPTKMRSNVMNQYPPVWVTGGGEILQDCGWHFTWMGNEQRRKEKANAFIHYANLSAVNTLSLDSMGEIITNINSNLLYQKKNYPIDSLPKVIFNLPRVREFLLPAKTDSRTEVLKLYEQFDNKFGEWGWCTAEKSNKIIDCVLEACGEKDSPICVEIGVYGGKSLIPFGAALKELGKGKVYGIDPWTNQDALVGYDHPNHQQFWGTVDLNKMHNICVEAIDELKLNDYVSLIVGSSNNVEVIENIDVIHIDGQHTEQLIRDINKYAVNVVVGGYCFVDDVGWSEETKKSIPLMKQLGFELQEDINGCYLYKRTNLGSKVFHANINLNKKPTAIIIDDFYSNPDEVREFALNQEYFEGGIGRGFIGRRTQGQFLFPNLKERFEQILGKKIIKWEDYEMNGKFQIAWAGEPLVWHCDSQVYGGMLYLTPNAPFQCGTTLYAHKKTRARTYYDEGWNVEWGDENGTTHLDGTPWEPVDVLGNVYNRLVLFDGSCIHSASEYFGHKPYNARLWQMFFFDTEP
jgi:hypothetical protein